MSAAKDREPRHRKAPQPFEGVELPRVNRARSKVRGGAQKSTSSATENTPPNAIKKGKTRQGIAKATGKKQLSIFLIVYMQLIIRSTAT
jgi:hypothetical protein